MTDGIDTEQVLEQFRRWLNNVNHEIEQRAEAPLAAGAEPSEAATAAMVDVVAAFTALRHELKLQTKSARSLQEESEQVLAGLSEAIRRFDTVQADESEAARRAAEPLAENLANLDEALERGMTALEQSRRQVVENSPPQLRTALEAAYRRQPIWRRWLIRPFYEIIRGEWLDDVVRTQQSAWDSMRDGYRLIGNRLRRSLESCGIRRIRTVGRPADPHSMTVVEVADDPARAPGTVIEELRPGYAWNDRVLRFAEVRAVRTPPEQDASTEGERPAGRE